jgi:hypothetical protein
MAGGPCIRYTGEFTTNYVNVGLGGVETKAGFQNEKKKLSEKILKYYTRAC